MKTMREAPHATVLTGAAGWLGSAVMEALTTDRAEWARPGTIRALVTNRAEGARLQALSTAVEPVIGDVTDISSLEPLFAGLTGTVDVIHTAGVIHPSRTADFDRINTGGTVSMLELARKHDARRFVHVSSNSPFGVNPHPADRFKLQRADHAKLQRADHAARTERAIPVVAVDPAGQHHDRRAAACAERTAAAGGSGRRIAADQFGAGVRHQEEQPAACRREDRGPAADVAQPRAQAVG